MWSSAASVRGFMKERGLKKETGCSWIELKGEVVSFSSNDSTHPLIEQICQEVDTMARFAKDKEEYGKEALDEWVTTYKSDKGTEDKCSP
uniref:DYW domain-containing protein n=1 Tax=Leersia perrieri TaxID=77586 RepID=A0A0D9W532_9ORYZ